MRPVNHCIKQVASFSLGNISSSRCMPITFSTRDDVTIIVGLAMKHTYGRPDLLFNKGEWCTLLCPQTAGSIIIVHIHTKSGHNNRRKKVVAHPSTLDIRSNM